MATCDMAPPPIATDALRAISTNYLLEKFRDRSESKDIDKVEEIDMIQALFEKSSDLFKVYGSPEEFMDNLKIYRNFTTSDKYFETKHAIPFYTTPIVYMSLKGGIFMAKSDFYVILEDIALRNHPHSNSIFHEVGVYSAFLALFIKMKAKDVNRKIEFVRFNHKKIVKIAKVFSNGMFCDKPSARYLRTQRSQFSRGNILDFKNKLMEYLPGVADDDTLFQRLESAYSDYDVEKRIIRFTHLLFELQTLMNCLNGIIKNRPHLFLRKSKEIQPSSSIVVRMFEDGDRQFVMKTELLEAIDLDVNYSPKVVYEVIDMKEVLEKYKDHVDRIEFIRTPILRSKHKAVPIRLMDSLEFCVLAVDGLFEVLKELILGLKLFQHVEEWPKAIFKQIHTVFDPKVNNPYFINLSVLTKLKKSINDNCLAPSSPLPEIRDVRFPGFTMRTLRKELKFLGLVKHFPEISDHAEMVYKELINNQKESNPRTCDMFDAVEKCQIRCIFDRVPELKTFLHHQKSCSRVIGLKCDTCNGAAPESIETIENSETTESLNILNLKRKSTFNEEKEEVKKLKRDALTQQKTMNKKKKIAALENELAELKEKLVKYHKEELEKLTEKKGIEISRKSATIDKMGREKGQLKAEIARYKANENVLMEAKFQDAATIDRLEKENNSMKSWNDNSVEFMRNIIDREERKFEEMNEKFSKKILELEQQLQKERRLTPPTATSSSSTVATSSHYHKCEICQNFINLRAQAMKCGRCGLRFHPECAWEMGDKCSQCLEPLLIIG